MALGTPVNQPFCVSSPFENRDDNTSFLPRAVLRIKYSNNWKVLKCYSDEDCTSRLRNTQRLGAFTHRAEGLRGEGNTKLHKGVGRVTEF